MALRPFHRRVRLRLVSLLRISLRVLSRLVRGFQLVENNSSKYWTSPYRAPRIWSEPALALSAEPIKTHVFVSDRDARAVARASQFAHSSFAAWSAVIRSPPSVNVRTRRPCRMVPALRRAVFRAHGCGRVSNSRASRLRSSNCGRDRSMGRHQTWGAEKTQAVAKDSPRLRFAGQFVFCRWMLSSVVWLIHATILLDRRAPN